jgi:hypothetical protein
MGVPDAPRKTRSLSRERASELASRGWASMTPDTKRQRMLLMRIAGGEAARRELDAMREAASEASAP